MSDATTVNWLFLGELIVVVIVTSAFLFYWNRLFGSLIAASIRLISWRVFNVYVVIGSLQISPLAGRISFRNVEYHSSNISFRALHGNVTFRYWKFRVRQEGDSDSNNSKRARQPCRIIVSVDGVEAFLFNRTPAYDAIVERMKKHERENTEAKERGDHQEDTMEPEGARFRKNAAKNLSREASNTSSQPTSSTPDPKLESPSEPSGDNDPAPSIKPSNSKRINGISWLRETLPIEVKIVTGSVVLGNDATPMVLIGDFKRADGMIEVTDARSPSDNYRLSVHFAFSSVNVLMRTNVDYTGPLLAHGKRTYNELLAQRPNIAQQPPSAISAFGGFHYLADKFRFLYDPKFSSPPASGLPTDRVWKGLARYRLPDEKSTKPVRREERQYAKCTTLLTTSGLDFTYYADSAGLVPERSEAIDIDPADEIGNIEPPPEYGIDIVLYGGNIKYGPWADRQRDALQKAFAPSIFFDSDPKAKLKPGDTRIHTNLVVNVSLAAQTILHIPTREPSKDWMFDNAKSDEERKYGWLDVSVGGNSTITYTQAQVATKHGYDSMLLLHLDSLKFESSVNQKTFITAKTCKLSMTMPTPLNWNAQRNWGIDLCLDAPDVSLLRDHVTLISDLSKDWSSGAVGDFHHFVPVHYNFRLSLINFAIHLFLNDFNIVDFPWSKDVNTFLDIYGPRLDTFVAVGATRFRPEFSVVPFTIEANDARVELTIPEWDTFLSFGNEPSLEVGKIGTIKVSGSYRYYSSARPEHQELLQLHVEAGDVVYKALGWVLRRMFSIKDNYFGTFTQFSTIKEYLEKFDHSPDSVGDPVVQKYRPGRSDPFAVQVTLDVRNSLILMSDEIYACGQGVAIPIPELQMLLKSNEFQMDLSLDIPPTYIVASDDLEQCYKSIDAPLVSSQDVVFIEGLEVKANRLFGPQPRGTTYFCLWELSTSRVSAFLSPSFNSTLASVGRAFGYTFSDIENAPTSVYVSQSPPDATFVKLSVKHMTVLMATGSSGLACELPQGLFVDTSSIASRSCHSVVEFGIPSVVVHALKSRSRHKGWEPTGSLKMSVAVDIYSIPKGWQEIAAAQQSFLREQDSLTRRVPYLYGSTDDSSLGHHVQFVYVPRPKKVAEVEYADDTLDDRFDGAALMDNLPSSPSSSDSGSSPPLRARRRKRSLSMVRKFNNANDDSSAGDESDCVSSTTSSSQTSSINRENNNCDAATILEAKLKSFYAIHHRAQAAYSHPSQSLPSLTDGESSHEALVIENGRIVNINIDKVTLDICPNSIASASDIFGAVSSTPVRREVQFDQLLSGHVSAVKNGLVRRDSVLYCITTPVVEVHLALTDPSKHEASMSCLLGGTSCRVRQKPVDNSNAVIIDVSAEIHSMEMTNASSAIQAPAISLLDVLDLNIASRYDRLLPLVILKSGDFNLTFHHSPRHQTIQFKVKDLDLQAVTPAVPVIKVLINSWTAAMRNLPKHEAGQSDASLIYHSLRSALATGGSVLEPALTFENAISYGLHVADQRNIRRDDGWLALSRLRLWSRALPAFRREPEPSPAVMANFVVHELSKLNHLGDAQDNIFTLQPFIRQSFGKDLEVAGLATPPNRDSMNISVAVESLTARHYGRLLEAVSIVPSVLTLESASIVTERHKTLKDGMPMLNIQVLVAVRKIFVDVRNSFISAHQMALGNYEEYSEEIQQLPPVQDIDHASTIIVDAHLGQANLSVTAGGVRLDVVIDGGQGSGTLRRSLRSQSTSHSRSSEHNSVLLTCRAVQTNLLTASDLPDTEGTGDRLLITSAVKGVRCVADSTLSNRTLGGGTCRLLFGVESFDFDSRPELKPFYDFGREWLDYHYPLYKPAIEDLKARFPSRPSRGGNVDKVAPRTTIDLFIGSARLQVLAAKGLWLGWDIGKVFINREGTTADFRFNIRLEPQVVGAYMSAKRIKVKDKQPSVLRLPSVTATGHYRMVHDRPHLGVAMNLGLFSGAVEPAALDRLLSLHERIGRDITDIFQDYRKSASSNAPVIPGKSSTSSRDRPMSMIFDLQLSIAGVRLGLRANNEPTTLMFEALELNGSATNLGAKLLRWKAKANQVGLSLGRMGDEQFDHLAETFRGSRSLSMVFDVDAKEIPGEGKSPSALNISLSRVHTVMHVAALSEVADLIKSWSTDITVLHNKRGAEVAEVKEQTTRVLRKLEAGSNPEGPAAPVESWFASRLLTVEITGFGIAIPLADIDLDKRIDRSGPALLYSIRVMSYTNSKNETARFRVQQTALQYLNRFDSGVIEHFKGDYHSSTNRMVLPSIDCEAQMTSTPDVWTLVAHCSATDFKLALTPEIADIILQLADLYERGKVHLSQMEQDYRTESLKRENQDLGAAKSYDVSESPTYSVQKVVVRMSFMFNSGVVEFHRPVSDKSSALPDLSYRRKLHDEFTLPTVSVWMDYAGPSNEENSKIGTLLFNTAVHESSNVLRPSILPFFVEIASRIEQRIKSRVGNISIPSERHIELIAMPVTESAIVTIAESPTGKLRLRVTLRIDRSELRLSCAPDSNAYVDFKWESGGFLASTLLGAEDTTTLAGSVSGVTAYLSHEFTERECIKAGAKDMAFSIALCTSDPVNRGLSIVIDTQVSVHFRLEAFSAWLIFMAVWVDNAPKLDIALHSTVPDPSLSTPSPSKMGIVSLIRFRAVDFDANIAISQAHLEMRPIVLRTISNGELTKVDLSIDATTVSANGDISGNVRSENIHFRTVRKSSRATATSDPTVLRMIIEGGDLHGNLFIDNQNIVRFQFEESTVTLSDDWKAFAKDPNAPVFLSFIVAAGKFHGVIRLPVIPRLLGHFYSIFDLADSQTKIAAQRSEVFKVRLARKAVEPTPMTNALLRGAVSSGTSSPPTSPIKTAQTMRFELQGIDLGIFHSFGNNPEEFFRFDVGKVEADLRRQSTPDGLPSRDLGLLVSYIEWHKSGAAQSSILETRGMSARELIDKAISFEKQTVAKLPLMTLRMKSMEETLGSVPTLLFDFDLQWGETGGDVMFLPLFFLSAIDSFKRLQKGIESEKEARMGKLGFGYYSRKTPRKEDVEEKLASLVHSKLIVYKPRSAPKINIPNFKPLGNVTEDLAKMFPQFQETRDRLPKYSHQFVTLPLEDAMDLLLKLYEKQLPEGSTS